MASATQRIAVITGASSGIGFETAKALAREGWRVIALGRDDHRIAQSKAGLAEAGHSAEWLQADFAALSDAQKKSICDDIAFVPDAKPQFKTAAEFFSRFRAICASAYYATPAGWEAIGYVGNVALHSFDGPPEEVLRKLGVTQTVA